MDITIISITNKTAPLNIRQCLSFTKRRQIELLHQIKSVFGVETVIVSTCNRTEFYFAGDTNIQELLNFVCSLAKTDVKKYLVTYSGDDAVRHLFMITPGLKSMVIGEDQILGQVRDAVTLSRENNCIGIYFNTLFRLAITAAKKIKTDTKLSEIPVSVATIAVQACIKELGTLNNKNILVTGASGHIGKIVLQNISAVSDAKIYITSRSRTPVVTEGNIIEYNNRYNYADKADCIISATSSPHYTYTAEMLRQSIKTDKKRVFLDLAVPPDIEKYNGCIYYCIDDLSQLSAQNNIKKQAEAQKAEQMLDEFINEFIVWRLFYENSDIVEKYKKQYDNYMDMLYKIKAQKNPDKFKAFLYSPEVYFK